MKTTPTLGLKLYDGTDAPDLVSGYNASMGTLDDARIMRHGGTLRILEADFNSLTATAYYSNDGYTFTADNHGPVGSHEYGILVVYDRCGDPDSRRCATQQYFPHKDGTGDAYRPMMRSLLNGKWSAWAPLVDVPDVEGALPANGAAGQVLVKSSASDYDCEWMNPSALNDMVAYRGDTKSLLVNGTEIAELQLSGGMDDAFIGVLGSAFAIQCQMSRNVYSSLTPSGLTMRNDGGTTSYTVGANGKGILNNITMINGDLPLKVGEEFKLKSNVIGADYKAMSAAFGFDGFNPAIGMGVLRLGSQGVQATCAVRVEASLVGSNLFTIYAVVFEPFINKNVTGFYMGGSATTTSTVDSNIDWGDSIYLTPLTKLKA